VTTIIKRAWARLLGGAPRLRRLEKATRYLMAHVRLSGRCECLEAHDAEGRAGCVLLIHTPLRIPAAEREQFRRYFQRKLGELGELGPKPLMLVIRDGEDIARARQQAGEVSSTRIASVIAAANDTPMEFVPSEQLARLRGVVRERLAERRQQRGESAYVPLSPLTDLGALS